MNIVNWPAVITDIVVFFVRVNHHVPGWNAPVGGAPINTIRRVKEEYIYPMTIFHERLD